MSNLEIEIFAALFKEAYRKCFGLSYQKALTEAESRHFSNEILEQTGLVLGWKSIKNYSQFVSDVNYRRPENPSLASLDTLARYIADARKTDEATRRKSEAHFPYWFAYKDSFLARGIPPGSAKPRKPLLRTGWVLSLLMILALAATGFYFFNVYNTAEKHFTETFDGKGGSRSLEKDWIVQNKDELYWERRDETAGHLTLFTLKGDNWPDSVNKPGIKNLLLRKISGDCFSTEIRLSGFLPLENWQQAGILLMEDTSYSGKSLRLSFVYNDFYGGFPQSREIITQAIVSNGSRSDKPEEIAHQVLFRIDSTNVELVRQNLRHSALRIEKQGSKLRLLYSNGSMANAAFKELSSQEIDIKPHFIGLFALRGFVNDATDLPARFDYFSYSSQPCSR